MVYKLIIKIYYIWFFIFKKVKYYFLDGLYRVLWILKRVLKKFDYLVNNLIMIWLIVLYGVIVIYLI